MPGPIFHFIVVVDVEGFGRRTIPFQADLRKAMYEVVRNAFDDAGLDQRPVVWLDRGDSIILLIPAASANNITLAGPFIRGLDASLREKGRMFAADHQMRMRVALHQGNCEEDATGWVGEAINTSTRLVDADPLRNVLKAATNSMMAFIVSDEIYRSVIRHGFRQIDSASFAPVQLHVKELHEKAWIQVPGLPYPPDGGVPTAPDGPVTPGPVTGHDRAPDQRHPPAGNSGGFTFHGPVQVDGDQIAGDKTVYGDRR